MFSVSERSPSSQWRMGALVEKRLINEGRNAIREVKVNDYARVG